MKILTVTQPYATFIILGLKEFETRSWPYHYCGEIGIHAGKGLGPVGGISGFEGILKDGMMMGLLMRQIEQDQGLKPCKRWIHSPLFPLGEILGKVDMAGCVKIDPEFKESLSLQEKIIGNYAYGRFAWKMENPRRFDTPIPAKGSQGIWNYEL